MAAPVSRFCPPYVDAEKSTTQILHILLGLRACEAEHELGCSSFEIGARLSKAVLGRTGDREGGEEAVIQHFRSALAGAQALDGGREVGCRQTLSPQQRRLR